VLDSYFREPYQKILVDPIATRLQLRSPHLITGLGCLFGIMVVPLLAFHWSLFAAGALLISGYCDTLDGTVARRLGRPTKAGAALDILSDRLVESAVIIGFFLFDPSRALLCLLMLMAAFLCVTSFLVVAIFTENESVKSFHYSPGIMERAEAFLFFLGMILLPSLFSQLAFAFSALVLLTAVVRTWQFIQNSRLRRQHIEVDHDML
jgi:phosphatidylglycerophosphate synthase